MKKFVILKTGTKWYFSRGKPANLLPFTVYNPHRGMEGTEKNLPCFTPLCDSVPPCETTLTFDVMILILFLTGHPLENPSTYQYFELRSMNEKMNSALVG